MKSIKAKMRQKERELPPSRLYLFLLMKSHEQRQKTSKILLENNKPFKIDKFNNSLNLIHD